MEPDQRYVDNLKSLIQLAKKGTFDTLWARNGMLATFFESIKRVSYCHSDVEAMCGDGNDY